MVRQMNSWMHFLYCCSVGLLLWYWPGWPKGASASRISSFIRARRNLAEKRKRQGAERDEWWKRGTHTHGSRNGIVRRRMTEGKIRGSKKVEIMRWEETVRMERWWCGKEPRGRWITEERKGQEEGGKERQQSIIGSHKGNDQIPLNHF